jgi:hypothetical protein
MSSGIDFLCSQNNKVDGLTQFHENYIIQKHEGTNIAELIENLIDKFAFLWIELQ